MFLLCSFGIAGEICMNMPLPREFRLSSVAGLGVRCDADGAFVGDVALLRRVGNEWAPFSGEELSAALSKTYGPPVDASAKEKGLATIARALNGGEVARAQLATLFAHFPDPPCLAKRAPSQDEIIKLALALDWAGLLKINTRHYPAGTSGGKGGQFAPKDEAAAQDADNANANDPTDFINTLEHDARNPTPKSQTELKVIDEVEAELSNAEQSGIRSETESVVAAAEEKVLAATEKKVAATEIRLFARRAIRTGALDALKVGGKLVLDAIPIIDIAAGISTAHDVLEMFQEYRAFRIAVKAVQEFVDRGPQTLKQLLVDSTPRSFKNFAALKKLDSIEELLAELQKFYGPAGEGMEYHHIIEQGSGLPADIVQNSDNVVRIPKILHEAINARYQQVVKESGNRSLREWLRGKPAWLQRLWGEKVMRDLGIMISE
jgi:hypothetical protein